MCLPISVSSQVSANYKAACNVLFKEAGKEHSLITPVGLKNMNHIYTCLEWGRQCCYWSYWDSYHINDYFRFTTLNQQKAQTCSLNILYYNTQCENIKYLRNKFVHFVGLVSNLLSITHETNNI